MARGRQVRKIGASLECALNRGHALKALDAHQTQSRGNPTATSFQPLQTWRNLNVPQAKNLLPYRRPDSTMQRNTSDRSSADKPEIGTWEFWADFSLLISLK